MSNIDVQQLTVDDSEWVNDNLRALRFYQKRGFALAVVHPNVLEAARKLKSEIPLTGYDGIPLRDEIELEIILPGGAGIG